MRKFICELKLGDIVKQIFLVRDKEYKRTRDNRPFITIDLCDKTGNIKGIVWDANEDVYNIFEKDDFVHIDGVITRFKSDDDIYIKVDSIKYSDESKIELKDYLPASEKDAERLAERINEVIDTFKDVHLKALLMSIVSDTEVFSRFKSAPAAVRFHHATIGGLIEHSLSVMELAMKLMDLIPGINGDILLTGALLHDIGKIYELDYRRSFSYTQLGELEGHITKGVEILVDKAQRIQGFPEDLLLSLKHIILSHHGQYEYGSPRLPKTVEAAVIHYLDNLDAKVYAFNEIKKNNNDPMTILRECGKVFEKR